MTRLIALTALALVAGCAPQPRPNASAPGLARECFLASQISGFSDARGATIRVQPSVDKTFSLTLLGPGCDDVGWAGEIAIESNPSPSICTDAGTSQGRVLFRDGASNRVVRCEIVSVVRTANRRS